MSEPESFGEADGEASRLSRHATDLWNLGHALLARLYLMGANADLDEAVQTGREAVVLLPAGHQGRPTGT
jgi:hypothetical protein